MYHPHRASPPPSQSSPIPTFNLDDDNFKPLWASASQPSQYTEGPSEPVEDDSPVEEVATIEEEVALCKAWIYASNDSVEGNAKKAAGFWTKVTEYFHTKMGEQKRSYNSVNCKWKNRIRPKVSQFFKIYNSVKDRHQCGACDTTIYQESEIKTSETTSQGNSDSAHIGVEINDEAADSKDVEVQVVRPLGQDAAKKKRASSGARLKSSTAGDPSLVDALVSKFIMAAMLFFSSRNESSSGYLRIKERELELEDQRRREQGELERLKIAQRDKELKVQQKMFKFQQQQKSEEDIKYYKEEHEHLTRRALSMALLLKKKLWSVGI
uniref:Glutathione S-transferase T3-like n=1 Tax=Tanacetum cinerariifolium TaxID=118510 RepID=A0A699IW59_TANCI|nr:hypothetical protein [Tanacetum cinerariifolium]